MSANHLIHGTSDLALGVLSKDIRKVYISNHNLGKSLPVGTKVIATYNEIDREIIVEKALDKKGSHTVSSKKNGTAVLDIKNKSVGDTFGNVDKIQVTFYEDKIVIKVPKQTLDEENRVLKNAPTCFEVCSGGGTATNFFEQAGFISRGAIELVEQNLAVFHENHKNQDIYTVHSNIENLDFNELPKDVTVLIITLPCTTATGANKKLAAEIKKKREGLPYDEEEIEKLERSDSLMYYALNIIQAMNPKTVVFENVEGYTKDPYDKNAERGIYTLAKSVLKTKGYKLSEHIGESHNTLRKRWTMIAHYADNAISLDNLVVDQTKSTIGELLAIKDEQREWGTVYDFAPSRLLNNRVGIRAVELDDYVTPTFSTHATRADFPILHKVIDGVDYYSAFTPEDIKNIHGLSKNFILPKEKSVALRILGQGVASMFYEVAKIIYAQYTNTVEVIDEVKEVQVCNLKKIINTKTVEKTINQEDEYVQSSFFDF